MKLSMMLLAVAFTALFSFNAAACGGCGCQKGEDDDDGDDVRMCEVQQSAETVGFCGKDGDGTGGEG